MTWQPSLGAWHEGEGTRFRVWAPQARTVEVIVEGRGSHALQKAADGTFGSLVPGVSAGDRYRYRVDGKGPYPDPASRFQPEGVHGPSEIVDASRFEWSDASWGGISRDDLVIYELHVGTFTPAGTFAGAMERLPQLVELGVTALELMPVADFPGQRNWGYDGVDLFAPARCYGRPDNLRRLVDSAHRLGLAVLLDVVYNHLGPDGNYLGVYSPFYFSKRHKTAWGDGLNFDGEHSDMVRGFFIENALHWIHEYHLDGLRLDATHAMKDDGERHFLAELSARVHESVANRPVHLIAEDHRNRADMVKPQNAGGWGLDEVWADDFHHQVRRHLAGDRDGYYQDFSGSTADVAATIRQGWFYCGQHSVHRNKPRGTDPADVFPRQFVWCLQNHDQIGNRALGDRLHHQIDLAAYRAASALLLCSPATPLLFMGQEWAAGTPFLFFTDHHQELGRRVTEGRRREFKSFAAFADPKVRERIPDPQAAATFLKSKLNWAEAEQEPHGGIRRLYQALLHLRRTEPALRNAERHSYAALAYGESAVVLLRRAADGPTMLLLVQLRGAGTIDLCAPEVESAALARHWETVLTTEDPPFSKDPSPPEIDLSGSAPVVRFLHPGAVVLREVS
ncbi:MAG TPA: malto-oligosyltrehalose trehalohydrolase [Gemmataceae bacterium]|nr:malto-oligosyltrehalose trehalohydrolase [Gemmataceae bacterium]